MGVFESQDKKTERLLQQELELLLESVATIGRSDPEWKAANESTHSSWLIGGFFAARGALRQSNALKAAWGKGDRRKAHSLLEVFTLPMLSRWWRMVDARMSPPEDARSLAREHAGTNILDLFGEASAAALSDFFDLDAQYNLDCHRLERQSGGVPLEAGLVLGRAVAACGGLPAIKWDRQRWPLNDLRELAEAVRGTMPPFLLDIVELMAISLVLNTAFRSMVEYYTSITAQS